MVKFDSYNLHKLKLFEIFSNNIHISNPWIWYVSTFICFLAVNIDALKYLLFSVFLRIVRFLTLNGIVLNRIFRLFAVIYKNTFGLYLLTWYPANLLSSDVSFVVVCKEMWRVWDFYPNCSYQISLPQVHGCWQKTRESWVRDRGPYYS